MYVCVCRSVGVIACACMCMCVCVCVTGIAELNAPSDERWGAGVEYHFQEFNEPYAPS